MASLKHPDAAHLDTAILTLGEAIWQRMQGERPGLFNAQHWQGRMLEWVMQDPGFKVDLFRLVDVLPTLSTCRPCLHDRTRMPPKRRLPRCSQAT